MGLTKTLLTNDVGHTDTKLVHVQDIEIYKIIIPRAPTCNMQIGEIHNGV